MAKGNFAKESFSSLPSWAKGVISIAVVAGVGYVLYKLSKKLNPESQRQEAENKDVENEIQQSVKKHPLSYPLS